MHTYISLSLYIYTYIYIYYFVYTHLSLYIYIYIYTYIYIYIYCMREEISPGLILVTARRLGLQTTSWFPSYFGWHYLSKATCLMRPHLFSTALLV